MQIAYIPFEQDENAYTTRMRQLLSHFGTVQRHAGVKPGLLAALRGRRYDVTIVNWYENEMFEHGRWSALRAAKVWARTVGLRLSTKRLVLVRHNVYPHGVAPDQAARARRWIDRYERLFHVSVTHGGHEAGGRRHYCPHPLYDAVPADPATETTSVETGPTGFFLMFGRIVPYKQIDAVMQHFPAERTLVVAGGAPNAAYLTTLQPHARHNVLLRAGYLSEADAQALARRCQALVIAHAEADVIVSGSFFYALSLGVPIIACRTPFLTWAQAVLGSDLVQLGDSPAQLCEIARHYQRRPIHEDVQQRVQMLFGDAEVLRCWREVLAPVLPRAQTRRGHTPAALAPHDTAAP